MEQGKKKPTIKKKTTFSPQQSSNESQNKPKGKRQSEDAVDQRGKNRGKDDSEMQEDEIEYEDHFEDEFEEEEQAQKEMGEEEDEGLELEGMTDADWEKLHQLQLNDGEAEAAEEGDDVAVCMDVCVYGIEFVCALQFSSFMCCSPFPTTYSLTRIRTASPITQSHRHTITPTLLH